MKEIFTYPSQDGQTQIHGIRWIPEGQINAVLQICHGMVEYIGRYDSFGTYLADHGYYVVGNDHLGHGQSVTSDDCHGFFHHPNGNECVIGDIHVLRERTQSEHPDVPYFMLGHSMGSFLVRQYMELYGEGLDGVIVMGTGSQPEPVLVAARFLCWLIALFHGWDYRSKLVDNMAFGSYNKRFEPARTDKDWLTKDEAVVDRYLADPWCTFRFTVNAYYQMFRGIQFLQQPGNIIRIPKNLPIFFVAGADDPVGNFGTSVQKVYQDYRDYGIRDIQIKLYPGDRHEILNETDRLTVYEDLLAWLEQRRAQPLHHYKLHLER